MRLDEEPALDSITLLKAEADTRGQLMDVLLSGDRKAIDAYSLERMVKCSMDEVIDAWKAAYLQANGKEPPPIIYANGWFTLIRAKYRRAEIEHMTQTLLSRVSATYDETEGAN
ncbi:hypothetical protein [Paenibacillus tepidiphilus]|uniref:hypothetical protein n=1 Tax=Paenibacillus tepidiphilus TaxID=2608683 RepID=UPI00123BA8E6|nr:hypothetical protein [Paenibacillus tepidiphilus]